MARSKDYSQLLENQTVKEQHKALHYELRDYGMKHRVHIYRDLNAEAERDLIFKLVIDDVEVLLDAEQVRRAIRWV